MLPSPPPACPMCGAPMALRRAVGRAPQETVEIRQCPACGGAGAAFYALVPSPAPATTTAGAAGPGGLARRYAIMTTLSLEQELKDAELAILHCQRHADRQRAEAERRDRLGHDSAPARRAMMTIRQVQTEHEAHRDRLLAERAEAREATAAGE